MQLYTCSLSASSNFECVDHLAAEAYHTTCHMLFPFALLLYLTKLCLLPCKPSLYLFLAWGLDGVFSGSFCWSLRGFFAWTGLWVSGGWIWWCFLRRGLCSFCGLCCWFTWLTFRLTCTRFTFLWLVSIFQYFREVLAVFSVLAWASLNCSVGLPLPLPVLGNLAAAMATGRCDELPPFYGLFGFHTLKRN